MAKNMSLSCILRRIGGPTVAGIILLALCPTAWAQMPICPAPNSFHFFTHSAHRCSAVREQWDYTV